MIKRYKKTCFQFQIVWQNAVILKFITISLFYFFIDFFCFNSIIYLHIFLHDLFKLFLFFFLIFSRSYAYFLVKMNILHLLEKTSPPFSLYLDFTVRTSGPLKVPEDSVCFQGACFRNELTSSKITSKLGFFTWVWKLYFSFTS